MYPQFFLRTEDVLTLFSTLTSQLTVFTYFRDKRRLLYGKYLATRAPRSTFAYATHIPYLVGIARLIKIKHVIEFGCGEFSTLTFLNREIFPSLERLDSFENDPKWVESVRIMADGDPRLKLTTQQGPMSQAASTVNFHGCDLVFIDDSLSGDDRAATIRAVARARPDTALVVIHDFEYLGYRDAARKFPHRVACHALNPAVGLVWSDAPIHEAQVRRLARLVKSSSHRLKPIEATRWAELFDSEILPANNREKYR